jgi:hypothetical protein
VVTCFQVPLGNIAFALPFVPGHEAMTIYDIIGLVTIMGGLVLYRFFGLFKGFYQARQLKQMGHIKSIHLNSDTDNVQH